MKSTPKFVEKSFLGDGKFFINRVRVGNVTAATLSYGTESKTLRNAQGGGGNVASTDRISNCTLALTITNVNAENVAKALQGSVTYVPTADIDGEAATCSPNQITPLENLVDMSKPVTVTLADDTPVPAADYDMSANGIYVKDDASVLVDDAMGVKISYSILPYAIIEAATKTGAEFAVYLDGINADNGNPHNLDVYRWKPAPTSGFDLISEDYNSFEITGEILADTSKASGVSQFFRLVMA